MPIVEDTGFPFRVSARREEMIHAHGVDYRVCFCRPHRNWTGTYQIGWPILLYPRQLFLWLEFAWYKLLMDLQADSISWEPSSLLNFGGFRRCNLRCHQKRVKLLRDYCQRLGLWHLHTSFGWFFCKFLPFLRSRIVVIPRAVPFHSCVEFLVCISFFLCFERRFPRPFGTKFVPVGRVFSPIYSPTQSRLEFVSLFRSQSFFEISKISKNHSMSSS